MFRWLTIHSLVLATLLAPSTCCCTWQHLSATVIEWTPGQKAVASTEHRCCHHKSHRADSERHPAGASSADSSERPTPSPHQCPCQGQRVVAMKAETTEALKDTTRLVDLVVAFVSAENFNTRVIPRPAFCTNSAWCTAGDRDIVALCHSLRC